MALDYGAPSPDEMAQYGAARRKSSTAYGQAQAQLAFQRQNANANYSQQFGDLARNYDQMRQKLPGQFVRRGVQNSGIYKDALTNYAQQRALAAGRLGQQQQQELGGYDLQQQAASQNYTNAQLDVAEAEAARRASIAAALKGLV